MEEDHIGIYVTWSIISVPFLSRFWQLFDLGLV